MMHFFFNYYIIECTPIVFSDSPSYVYAVSSPYDSKTNITCKLDDVGSPAVTVLIGVVVLVSS